MDRDVLLDRRAAIMGVLNVTPDSFSDGGRSATVDVALENGRRLSREGADIVDVGGESTRPGASPVSLEDEQARVAPVVEALAGESSVTISIDTIKPEVARLALRLGAAIVNDMNGLRDPEMLRVVAESNAGVVVGHMRGEPRTMQKGPRYDDVVLEVYDWLAARVELAVSAGIARERIAIDLGIGFGKTIEHNLALLRNLSRFAGLDCAIMIGVSRKGFLGALTGRPVEAREFATVAANLAAVSRGANILRVHDVAATLDSLRVWNAIDDGTRL